MFKNCNWKLFNWIWILVGHTGWSKLALIELIRNHIKKTHLPQWGVNCRNPCTFTLQLLFTCSLKLKPFGQNQQLRAMGQTDIATTRLNQSKAQDLFMKNKFTLDFFSSILDTQAFIFPYIRVEAISRDKDLFF